MDSVFNITFFGENNFFTLVGVTDWIFNPVLSQHHLGGTLNWEAQLFSLPQVYSQGSTLSLQGLMFSRCRMSAVCQVMSHIDWTPSLPPWDLHSREGGRH